MVWFKKHNILPHIKIIDCHICEIIFQTINYKKAIEKKKRAWGNNCWATPLHKTHVIEQCDIEDEDKVQENTANRTPKKNYKSGNMCWTSHQSSGANNVVKF